MDYNPHYSFDLPPEEKVIKRNRTITTYYAQLYQNEPQLYKWAGMAAFASFHIGEKLKMWDWESSGIKSFATTCLKKNKTLEDDFQIIRIINNRIFNEIGGLHLAFCQMDFVSFQSLLLVEGRHKLIINAFDKLNTAREQLKKNGITKDIEELIWDANTEILWHEQSEVVQPLFDKLSNLFSGFMTIFASFDYKINHHKTSWKIPSAFILFMLFNGYRLIIKSRMIPKVTHLQHRWYWICNDLLKKWRRIESDSNLVTEEIEVLSKIELRNLKMKKP
jgi:hypothetical protein